MWDWPNLFSLAKSTFIGQIHFHWCCEIIFHYFVKYMMYVPVPQKLIFTKNLLFKKALFVNVVRE